MIRIRKCAKQLFGSLMPTEGIVIGPSPRTMPFLGPPLRPWASQLDRGTPRSQLVLAIEGSGEFHLDVVQNLYSQVLGRAADATGLAVWKKFLDQGAKLQPLVRRGCPYPKRRRHQLSLGRGFARDNRAKSIEYPLAASFNELDEFPLRGKAL
jgi:hypothetical protein